MKVKIEIDCNKDYFSHQTGDEVIRILERYVESYKLDNGITRSLFDEHGKRVGGAWIEQ